VPGLSNYKTDYNGSGYNCKGKGKDNNSGGNRQVVFYNLEIEGYIVEK
jgi:hypothetical protein